MVGVVVLAASVCVWLWWVFFSYLDYRYVDEGEKKTSRCGVNPTRRERERNIV